MLSYRFKNLIIIVIVAAVGAFYISTIREGHDWGGDFSMYIHHAKNIVNGMDYKDTGYVYNPSCPSWGPKTYPPVFPLLLALVYKLFGLNLAVMKTEIIFIFLLFLLTIFLLFRKKLPFYYSAFFILIIGFNPYFWDFKDQILSDIPFAFFFYLTLLFIYKEPGQHKTLIVSFLCAILIGFLMYATYGTRGIGIILPILFIYDALKFKKPVGFAVTVIFAFIFFMLLQSVFFHADAVYFKELSAITVNTITGNLLSYIRRLSGLWDNGYSMIARCVLFAVVSAAALIGYLTEAKRRFSILELFAVSYALIVIVWPAYQGMRYLLPLLPLYILYAFIGIKQACFRNSRAEKVVFAILISAILLSYGFKYTNMDYGPIKEGIGKSETKELFNYIKNNTAEDAVFIFQKPRVLSLYTGRKASAYHCPYNDNDLRGYFRQINASYIISGKPFYTDQEYLCRFIEKYKMDFEEVYSNPDFSLYKIEYPLD